MGAEKDINSTVIGNLDIVKYEMRELHNIPTQLRPELEQEGYLTLVLAAHHFDGSRGTSFRSYASVAVRRRLWRVVRKHYTDSNQVFYTTFDFLDRRGDPDTTLNIVLIAEVFNELRKASCGKISVEIGLDAILLHSQGFSCHEIAQKWDRSPGYIASVLARTRRKVIAILYPQTG